MLRCDGKSRDAGGSGQRTRRSRLPTAGPRDGVFHPSTFPTGRELRVGLEKGSVPRLISPGDGRHRVRVLASGGSGFVAIALALGMNPGVAAVAGPREKRRRCPLLKGETAAPGRRRRLWLPSPSPLLLPLCARPRASIHLRATSRWPLLPSETGTALAPSTDPRLSAALVRRCPVDRGSPPPPVAGRPIAAPARWCQSHPDARSQPLAETASSAVRRPKPRSRFHPVVPGDSHAPAPPVARLSVLTRAQLEG